MTKSTGKGSGRMPSITEAKVAQIAALTPDLLYAAPVAAAMGIAKRTLNRWLRLGERAERKQADGATLTKREELYLSAARAFDGGLVRCMQRHLGNIQKAADDGVWQASAWMMERRFPKWWSQYRAQIQVLEKEIAELGKKWEEMERQQQAQQQGGYPWQAGGVFPPPTIPHPALSAPDGHDDGPRAS